MIQTQEIARYQAFGLNIMSEYFLPELKNVKGSEEIMDITIEIGELHSLWEEKAKPTKYFVIEENQCLFKIPEVAIYLIQEGKRIIVSPYENASEDIIRLYILGTCMGAILMQRKILPLHGSAVEIDGKAYAIVGDSGAGKSTLASAFLNKGFKLLSDDVIPVILTENHQPIVIPAYPQQKLWLESLNEFGMNSENYRPIIDRETKFAIPVSAQFSSVSMPLAGIFELIKSDDEEISIRSIQKLESLHTVFNHTYRNFILKGSGLMEWHFRMTAQMINKIRVYQVCRPQSKFTANSLTDLLLTTLKVGEKVHD
ncbi:phosphoenolpyruvate carboxykinase (ATP) [Rossellomorea aquimaris]|uniref:hypothetical protein n=1 Tax=Rossellomorea aquimaris TaxID=189382 RepID=UPI0007D088AC